MKKLVERGLLKQLPGLIGRTPLGKCPTSRIYNVIGRACRHRKGQDLRRGSHQPPGLRRAYSLLSQDGSGDRSPKRHQIYPCPPCSPSTGAVSEIQHPKDYQLYPREENALPAPKSLWRKGQLHSAPSCIKLRCATLRWLQQRAGTCRIDVKVPGCNQSMAISLRC